MHRYTFFLWVVILLAACGKNRVPPEFIQPNKMAPLLIDIHLADGKVYMATTPDSINKYGLATYKAVFAKHGVDSIQFRKSFQYYAEHPIEMDKIYERVVAALQVKQDSVTKVVRVNDSVRAARAGDSIKRKLKADSLKNVQRIDSVKRKKKNVLPR